MKIKGLIMTAALAILTATASRADDNMNAQGTCQCFFKGNELSLDGFGAYTTVVNTRSGPFGNSVSSSRGGGGLGLNYYFTRYFGIGAESAAFAGSSHENRFIDYAGGNLFARFPLDTIHLAPYAIFSGGRAFNPNWNWYAGLGGGLDYRICPKIGIFGDARYLWREIGNSNSGGNINGRINLVEARFGVRFIFF